MSALAPFGRLVQLGLRRGQEVTFDFKVRRPCSHPSRAAAERHAYTRIPLYAACTLSAPSAQELMNKWGVITGGHLRPRTLQQKGATRDALREHVLPLWRAGMLPAPEVSVLPLAEASTGHVMLEQSRVIGKAVLRAF